MTHKTERRLMGTTCTTSPSLNAVQKQRAAIIFATTPQAIVTSPLEFKSFTPPSSFVNGMARRSRADAVMVEIAIPKDSEGKTTRAYFLKTNVRENRKEGDNRNEKVKE